MTQLSYWLDARIDGAGLRLIRFIRSALSILTVGVALATAGLSASWARTRRSAAWRYADRYLYRTRHHRHVFSHRVQIDAAVLAAELYWERVKRTGLIDVTVIGGYAKGRSWFREAWDRSWSSEHEAAFIRFNTDASC